MKNKKLLLPAVILAVAVVLIALYSVVSSIAKTPTITKQDFPFSITYELNGETKTIQDVYHVRYDRNDGYADTKTRVYVGNIGDRQDEDTSYILLKNEEGSLVLITKLYADYLMGDTEYDYFDDENFEPLILWYDLEGYEHSDQATLQEKKVKLVSYEYPSPIKNSFVFSHISYFSNAIVLPTLLISLLALVVVIIFVKKEKDLKQKALRIISFILNLIISLTIVPFTTVLGIFIDINGGGPEFSRQMLYFIPSLSLLGVAASVALRRKGYAKMSLFAQFIGPAVFAVFLAVCVALELL